MGKIYIRTYAYNAEKTLPRTIASVLNQTYGDFVYYLCDNGSTDGTRAIVEHYAKLDSRIRPFYNSINRAYRETEECLFLPYNIPDDDYFCTLDADDEYNPTFFSDMLQFIQENNLDIAACGSDFLSVAQNNKLVSQRLLPRDIILQDHTFANYFPYYHVFVRTFWGKLYKGFTLCNTVQDTSTVSDFPTAYGGDTYNTLLAFKSAKRVGILAKSLHKYYISDKSVSFKFHPERVKADRVLHKSTLDYLIYHNALTPQNEDFLLLVYLNALRDTFDILFHAKINDSEKLNRLHEMLNCPYTIQLAAREDFGLFINSAEYVQNLRRSFFMSIAQLLLKIENVSEDQLADYCFMGEFCCAAADFAEGWISFKKLHIRYLICGKNYVEAKKEFDEIETLIPDDPDIRSIRIALSEI